MGKVTSAADGEPPYLCAYIRCNRLPVTEVTTLSFFRAMQHQPDASTASDCPLLAQLSQLELCISHMKTLLHDTQPRKVW